MTTTVLARDSSGRHPGTLHPQNVYAAVLKATTTPGMKWLDIGCGRQIAPEWAWPLTEQRKALTGVELTGLDTDPAIHEHPFLTHKLVGLANAIDAPNDFFDLVTANMVMEHVPDPLTVYREVHRVLKSGGRFIIHTPNKYFYLLFLSSFAPDRLKEKVIFWLERRKSEDVFPTFYRSNTRRDLIRLATDAGFAVESIESLPPTASFGAVPVLRTIEGVILPMFSAPRMANWRATFIVRLTKR